MNENYLLNDVAKRLGVKHYRIAYALTTGSSQSRKHESLASTFSTTRMSNGWRPTSGSNLGETGKAPHRQAVVDGVGRARPEFPPASTDRGLPPRGP